jgi:hypothetical protein
MTIPCSSATIIKLHRAPSYWLRIQTETRCNWRSEVESNYNLTSRPVTSSGVQKVTLCGQPSPVWNEYGALSPGLKQPRREDDNSLPPNVDVKKEWRNSSALHNSSWCGVPHRTLPYRLLARVWENWYGPILFKKESRILWPYSNRHVQREFRGSPHTMQLIL